MKKEKIYLKNKFYWLIVFVLMIISLACNAIAYFSTFFVGDKIVDTFSKIGINISLNAANIIVVSVAALFSVITFLFAMKGHAFNKKETVLFLLEFESNKKFSSFNLVYPFLSFFLAPVAFLIGVSAHMFDWIPFKEEWQLFYFISVGLVLLLGWIGSMSVHFKYSKLEKSVNKEIQEVNVHNIVPLSIAQPIQAQPIQAQPIQAQPNFNAHFAGNVAQMPATMASNPATQNQPYPQSMPYTPVNNQIYDYQYYSSPAQFFYPQSQQQPQKQNIMPGNFQNPLNRPVNVQNINQPNLKK
ncbi:hypothetical protein [Spiroplasma endosymbiont of Amphibalanus improvisus]|uniref:hypothetical protein n=1 Tax=Spiroplasma endosymbiont of Amphibalanus improvisus TaxID=3066327 RepID=UPI00313ADFF3